MVADVPGKFSVGKQNANPLTILVYIVYMSLHNVRRVRILVEQQKIRS